MLQNMDSRLDEMNKNFDELKTSTERFDTRLDRMQHDIQQSRPAEEAGASGEKTGEREGDAAVNWRNGDIQFINRTGENSSANEEQLFSNNVEQGHLTLSMSGSSSRRRITDSSGRNENSSGESHAREIQSVAARAVSDGPVRLIYYCCSTHPLIR